MGVAQESATPLFLAQVSHNRLGSICACRITLPVQIEEIGTHTIGNIVEQSKNLEDKIRKLINWYDAADLGRRLQLQEVFLFEKFAIIL